MTRYFLLTGFDLCTPPTSHAGAATTQGETHPPPGRIEAKINEDANLTSTTREGTYFPWSSTQEGSIRFTDVTGSTDTTSISSTPSDKEPGAILTAPPENYPTVWLIYTREKQIHHRFNRTPSFSDTSKGGRDEGGDESAEENENRLSRRLALL